MKILHIFRSSAFYAILFLAISLMLVFVCFSLTAYAEEPAPDVVTDWTELHEWLENHKDVGGTVTFGADIEADEIDFQGDDFALPVIIDTASYGLTAHTYLRSGLDGVNPDGHLTIMGEGVDTPVLSYTGVYSYSSYYLDLSFLTIIAYGCEGQGGTAFYSSYSLEWQNMGDSPNIYANGADAVGIDCGADVDISWLTVESDGMAIRAAGDIRLFGCHIKGDLSGSEVRLDSCDAPDIPSATVIHRKISSIRVGRYLILGKPYAYQVAGRPVNEDWFSESRRDIYYFVIMSADGEPDEYANVYVKYSREDIDTETIGAITRLPAQFFVSLEGLNILPEEITFDLTVETVDGLIPHFIDNQSWGDYRFNYLYTGETLTPLTLWRSDDDGVSWYKIWRESDPELTGAEVNYYDDILTVQIPSFDYDTWEEVNRAPFLLAFETDGLTGGHIVFFDPATGEVDPYLNGDRDGGDRMILPWEVFAGGDTGDTGDTSDAGNTGGTGGTGNTGGSNGNNSDENQQGTLFPDNKGNTDSGNPMNDYSHSDNTGIGQETSLSTTDPQDKSSAPNDPAAGDMQHISDSDNSDMNTSPVAEAPIIEVQGDAPPRDLLPIIQYGDNLIMEPDIAYSTDPLANQQLLAPNAATDTGSLSEFGAGIKPETKPEQVLEIPKINDDPSKQEAGGQKETGEKAPVMMMDMQPFQAEQPDGLSFNSGKNGFPVLPVVAGLALVGIAGSVVYVFGKRRLYHK